MGSIENLKTDLPGEYSTQSKKSNCVLQYFALGTQALFVILFGVLGTKRPHAHLSDDASDAAKEHHAKISYHTANSYAAFQDVHVMIYIGFGFLMTFLKKFNWSSVGFNFLLGAICLQWALILHALFFNDNTIHLDYENLFEAEFATGAVLISFGAVLGKTSHLQLAVMAMCELVFYKLNQWLLVEKIAAGDEILQDIGGSMVIHAFGAYFGLAVARFIYEDKHVDHCNEGSTGVSDLFAMIGTVFLWMFWPSFNSIPAIDDLERETTVCNTYLALGAACLTAFAISGLDDKNKRLDMVHIQNATLAGGVAMGSSANFAMPGYVALLIGMIAGFVSTAGYIYLTPLLVKTVNIHDTCGVNNLHGMPGIMGAIFSIIVGASMGLENGFSVVMQLKALFCTLGVSIVGGIITSFAVKFAGFKENRDMYEDNEFWKKHG